MIVTQRHFPSYVRDTCTSHDMDHGISWSLASIGNESTRISPRVQRRFGCLKQWIFSFPLCIVSIKNMGTESVARRLGCLEGWTCDRLHEIKQT